MHRITRLSLACVLAFVLACGATAATPSHAAAAAPGARCIRDALEADIQYDMPLTACGKETSMFDWLSTCVVITNAFILPTQLVQDLRARARNIELRMQLSHHAATAAQLAALQSRTIPHFLSTASTPWLA